MIKIELSEKEKNELTPEEQEMAIVRKLEITMLPLLRRNINFFYAGANIPKKSLAYNTPMSKEDVEKSLKEKSAVIAAVCKPLCEMAVEILNDNGITAETVSCDTDMFRHVDLLVTTSSGKQHIINLLEDMENIQTFMKTPDFASEAYYERRYKKFEGKTTTDGKRLDRIAFIPEGRLAKIDGNLGYRAWNMYMDEVIDQIQEEFKNSGLVREVIAEDEFISEVCRKEEEEGRTFSETEKQELKKSIEEKYQAMSDDELLEPKLDWIFKYFNQRMNIKGHTDFVMYYSRLLLQRVLSEEEYKKLTRYDCFVSEGDVPEGSPIGDIIDYENAEETTRHRFCLLRCGNKVYAFSTKPNAYAKLSEEEFDEVNKYAKISKSEKPSELVIKLCMRGNALPLIFHPLGQKILNERAELIDNTLSQEDREKAITALAAAIKATDGAVTSITIPYPGGTEKYLYITEDNEFAIKTAEGTTIYHYDEEKDEFTTEFISAGGNSVRGKKVEDEPEL